MLKLRKVTDGDGWKGKVSYQDVEIEISDPLAVEKEISKGKHPRALPSPFGGLMNCVQCTGPPRHCSHFLFSGLSLEDQPLPLLHPPSLHASPPPTPHQMQK